jgi:hypothetical protein
LKQELNFSKTDFEKFLSRLRRFNLGAWEDVTEVLEKELEILNWEYVYKFRVNKRLSILVYSGIDRVSNKTRTRVDGFDTVKVILRLKSSDGVMYKKIKELKHVESLFSELERVLLLARNGRFVISETGWSKYIMLVYRV